MFTDIFIKRPVLAISISILIVILGLQSLFKLPIREYPEMTTTIVTVSTSYSGADSNLMQSFVTSTIEEAVAQADNIDYMKSSSSAGRSTITVKMKMNTDPDKALSDVSSKVNSVRKRLPSDIDDPVITVTSGDMNAIMFISFISKDLHISQVTDYVERNIKPQFYTIDGLAKADVFGGAKYGFRIWLDNDKLKAYNISTETINGALSKNNVQSAAGNSNSYYVTYQNNLQTTTKSLEDLQNLVIIEKENKIVKLKDLALVELDKSSDSTRASANGKEAVVLSIEPTPTANPINVAKNVYPIFEQIKKDLPATIEANILYDKTIAIDHSINEVIQTILEATLIVLVVITLFIGSFRAILIPIITIPISLIGVILLLEVFGFSINLMTLLALILAIGLVVDDAIVVLENVDRLIKKGEKPFDAAVKGTREIATPVISMTIALCAVYSPMALMDGITGSLFKEFALTLAGAVFISGIIALTLSPVMSSKLLKSNEKPSKLEEKIEIFLTKITNCYEKLLEDFLNHKKIVLTFAALIFISIPLSFKHLGSELTPYEDKSNLMLMGTGPDHVNLDYVEKMSKPFEQQMREKFPEVKYSQIIAGIGGGNGAFIITSLKDVEERSKSQTQLQKEISGFANQYAPMSFNAFSRAEINTGENGPPVSMIIKSSGSYEDLANAADSILEKANSSGQFLFINSDLKFTTPKVNITVNKDKANLFGLTMSDLSSTINSYLSGKTIARIDLDGKVYDVISQVEREKRLNPEDLKNITVLNNKGKNIPLSSIIEMEIKAEPKSLSKMNQMNSVAISGVPSSNVGDATNYLISLTNELPSGYQYEFSGESRQFIQEGNTMIKTFVLAVLIIYLVLAIQFESWRDPLVILISVPLAISGALITLNLLGFLNIGISTLNIYSQVGLITLVGLITKHGILICEVAKEQQLHYGKNKYEAVKQAAILRLRPILMTTFAMIAGLIPLLYAIGAGANSRFSIGVVIISGLAIGTLFTLFILPTIYTLIAEKHKPLKEINY